MTKEEAAMWANANRSQIQQKNHCIAAHSTANEELDIDVTINERMAKDSEPMSSDNSVIKKRDLLPTPGTSTRMTDYLMEMNRMLMAKQFLKD